ncbi:MAG: lysophospholipid acyltransferase family protein [Planctomycetota bacterium]
MNRWTAAKSWFLDAITYALVRLIVAVVQIMPLDMGDHLSRSLATVLCGPLPIRRDEIESNLTSIFTKMSAKDRHHLTWAMWHHLMLMVCEIAWAQRRLHRCNWYRHVRFSRNRECLSHMLSGRPMVLVTGHYGNFEIGGYVNGLMGVRATTIARKLDNQFLHDWVLQFRAQKGQDMVDKVGCAPKVDQHLACGGTLTLLADQHAGERGVWLDFCGRPASSHKALALFSLSSDAPMLAVYTRRIEGRPMQFETGLIDAVDPQANADGACDDVSSLTQWYNHQLERMIDLAPEQYWWLHRRWRTPPPRVAKRIARKRLEPRSAA